MTQIALLFSKDGEEVFVLHGLNNDFLTTVRVSDD